nr:hypothetical protein [uncultured Ruminococcus sp.]
MQPCLQVRGKQKIESLQKLAVRAVRIDCTQSQSDQKQTDKKKRDPPSLEKRTQIGYPHSPVRMDGRRFFE